MIDFHLISLWLENIICNNFKRIETYFYDPKYNLSWQIFCAFEKNVCSAVVGWSALKMKIGQVNCVFFK